MPQISASNNLSKTQKAILSTLSFFHIYRLPLSEERIWELLYQAQASRLEVAEGLLTIDLSDSDPQNPSFMNSSWGSTCGSALLPVISALDDDISINSGLLTLAVITGNPTGGPGVTKVMALSPFTSLPI